MTPEEYDAWYRTPRGEWIGGTEYRLLARMLAAEPRASILDIGCGTGYFSRRFALAGHPVVGLDSDPAMIDYASAHRAADESYAVADAIDLPCHDGAFEYCICITALCFIAEQRKALEEMARVARRGIALGLLNRRSLLYLQKGRRGGRGAYRGAHWHTPEEARVLLADLPFDEPQIKSAVFLPSGGTVSARIEPLVPDRMRLGAFLAISAKKRVRPEIPAITGPLHNGNSGGIPSGLSA